MRFTIHETPEGYLAALEVMAYAWTGSYRVTAPLTAAYWLQGFGQGNFGTR
jgi:hypothetical protein